MTSRHAQQSLGMHAMSAPSAGLCRVESDGTECRRLIVSSSCRAVGVWPTAYAPWQTSKNRKCRALAGCRIFALQPYHPTTLPTPPSHPAAATAAMSKKGPAEALPYHSRPPALAALTWRDTRQCIAWRCRRPHLHESQAFKIAQDTTFHLSFLDPSTWAQRRSPLAPG
jgi:hypothetical protein